MDQDQRELSKQAEKWVKSNSDQLIERFASLDDYLSEEEPTSIFMAGSPGAGKTEFSKGLIEEFKQKPVRIDADEVRETIPQYTGGNAHLFQKASTTGVNKLYDHVLDNSLSFVMDTTFAYAKAIQNVERALKRDYLVEIYFVYQAPKLAWHFTQMREAIEGRRIKQESFIKSYVHAWQNANQAKQEFGDKVMLNVVIKNYQNELQNFELNVDSIDPYLPEKYTKDELKELLQ